MEVELWARLSVCFWAYKTHAKPETQMEATVDFDLPKHSKSIRPLILSASFDEISPLVWHCGGPFCVPAFSYVLRTKTRTFFVTLFLLQFPCFEALEACLEACPKVFCSNSHGLATLELETCIEACLQYILHLLNFWFDNLSLSNMLTKESKACKRGASRLGKPDRGHASDAKPIGTRTKRGSRGLETAEYYC